MLKLWTEAKHYQTNILPCLAVGIFPESCSLTPRLPPTASLITSHCPPSHPNSTSKPRPQPQSSPIDSCVPGQRFSVFFN